MKMITRYTPNDRFRTISTLSKFMDEVLGDGATDVRSGWVPAVDIKETTTDLTFFVELPGFRQEDIEVEMVGEVLTIRGNREFSTEDSKDDYVRVERSYGSFQRTFTVGVPVKTTDITASYNNGVLTVRVPKADSVQPRKIAISNN